jgi:hypothetical protein
MADRTLIVIVAVLLLVVVFITVLWPYVLQPIPVH